MKIYSSSIKGCLSWGMIKKEFEITDNFNKCDYGICWTFISPKIINSPHIIQNLKKIIYIAYEVPLTQHVYHNYCNFNKMHTVFTYNPQEKNQFPITNNPLNYPVSPMFDWDIVRKDTTITKRKIFYAGSKAGHMYKYVPDSFGLNVKQLRDDICKWLLKKYPKQTIILGAGWSKDTRVKNWRFYKIQEVENLKVDFHLCIENYIMPNLVSERIHDGFGSNRVVLYLGAPNIHQFVPKDCFIDLQPLFNKKTKQFNYEGLMTLINNITQEEYDNILNAARNWRKNQPRDGHIKAQNKLTQNIINRIKNSA